MIVTQLFIRLIKNNGLYIKVMKGFKSYYYFYNGVIENLLQRYSIRDILYQCGLNAIETNQIIREWKIELEEMKINQIKRNDICSNYATQLLKDFICTYNIEKEVTKILFEQGKIAKSKINTNDIDILLRNNGNIRLYRFFSCNKTFCTWDNYNHMLNNKFKNDWCRVSELWEEYLMSRNINDVCV